MFKFPEYYRLIYIPEHELPENSLMTAAIMSCSVCNEPISGMGGPGYGDEVCLKCIEKLYKWDENDE